MITIIFLREWRTPLPHWRFPSTFTQVSGGSHDDGVAHSPLELQTHFSNESGERDIGGGEDREGHASSQTIRLVEMLDPSYHPFYLVSSFLCPGKKPGNLQTSPDPSQKQLQSFDLPGSVPEPTLVFCHKQYQTKYIPSSSTQTNEEWNKTFCEVVSISWKLFFFT